MCIWYYKYAYDILIRLNTKIMLKFCLRYHVWIFENFFVELWQCWASVDLLTVGDAANASGRFPAVQRFHAEV